MHIVFQFSKQSPGICPDFVLLNIQFFFQSVCKHGGKIYARFFRFIAEPARNCAILLYSAHIVFSAIIVEIGVDKRNNFIFGVFYAFPC